MSDCFDSIPPPALRRPRLSLVPVLAVLAALFVIAILGPLELTTWLLLGPLAFAAFVFAIARLPLLIFWLVPVSMCWFTYLPLVHYEALVVLLAVLLALEAIHRLDGRRLTLEPIEWRYALFLIALLPGFFIAVSLWRYFGALKLYAVGLLGFEVARRGSRRFGREAMLWGSLLFVAITSVMLIARVAQSGVPGFKGALLRTYLSRLTWGSSNYVSAVLVLCMPATVLAIRLSPAGSRRRWCAICVLLAGLITPLFTASRGGFLLSVAYLLSLATRVRRSLGALAAVTASAFVALGVLLLTPFGEPLIARFTDPRAIDSITGRVLIWQAAWARCLSHLPLGVGAGQGLVTSDALSVTDPHNFLLSLLGELGVAALVLWVWMIFTLWRVGRALSEHLDTRHAGKALRATLALVFVNMLFEPTLTGNLYHLLFWWLIGIFYGLGALGERPARV
jgi:hypothetical protein